MQAIELARSCSTRWSSRYLEVERFLRRFDCILDTLSIFENDKDAETSVAAKSLLGTLQTKKFVTLLVFLVGCTITLIFAQKFFKSRQKLFLLVSYWLPTWRKGWSISSLTRLSNTKLSKLSYQTGTEYTIWTVCNRHQRLWNRSFPFVYCSARWISARYFDRCTGCHWQRYFPWCLQLISDSYDYPLWRE